MRKEKKHHYIYKTTNLLSGRYYIGMHSSDNLKDGYLGSGTYLKRSLNKHGKENHSLEILEFCKSRNELKSREAEIVNLNEIAKNDCMNLRVGGGVSGEYWLNNTITPYWLGKHRSDDTKSKIRKGNLNKILTDETKSKISKNHSKYWLGKERSIETRIKIVDSNKGKVRSDVTRKKMSIAKQNMSSETKEKISNKLRGSVHSIVECPYCKKQGGQNNMKRWHFDNCKNKEKK